MAETFTQEDYEALKRIIGSFPAFLEYVGIEAHQPTVDLLLSDERRIEVPPEATKTIVAWTTWRSNYRTDTTTLWLATPQKTALTRRSEVETMNQELGKFGCGIYEDAMLSFDNGSRAIFRAATSSAGRGLSVHDMIVENVAKGSKLDQEISMNMSPCFAHSWGGRWINIR